MPALGVAGTTTADMQRIIAATYASDGIIDGCDVAGTSTMNYTVSAGAIVLNTGTDMAVIVPVPATTLPTEAAPAVGSRTDTIYVQQNFPTQANPDNTSFVAVTSGAAPSGSYIIDRRTVPAGATATTATTSVHNRRFALTIGGSLGTRFHEQVTDPTVRTTGTFTRGAGSLVCPTDRDVDFRFITSVSAVTTSGAISDTVGALHYQLFIDDEMVRTFERKFDQFFETKQFSYLARLTEGRHTFYYTVSKSPGGNAPAWRIRAGGTEKWPGDILHVLDVGVSNR